MTRLGWTILALILIAAAAFGSMLSVVPGGRPEPRPVLAAAAPPLAPGTPGIAAPAGGVLLTVPVDGVRRETIEDSWGDARGGGTRVHHGTDLPAPAGARVIAAAAGTIEKVFQSKLGGNTLYVRSPAGGWIYYYAHLAGYAPGLREGLRVRAGQLLGFVGDTGDAGLGNYHLHFGLQRMRAGERWWQGEDVDPYPYLAGGTSSR